MHTLHYRFQLRLERIAFRYQPYLARVAAVLAIITALSLFLYGIFLLEAVAQAGARNSAERQIHTISSDLSVLEGQYLAQTQALTPERAQQLGYVAPKQVSTVVTTSAPSPLSFAPQK
jgi:hypothetical protein